VDRAPSVDAGVGARPPPRGSGPAIPQRLKVAA
jgi:hypothetical protein